MAHSYMTQQVEEVGCYWCPHSLFPSVPLKVDSANKRQIIKCRGNLGLWAKCSPSVNINLCANQCLTEW